MVFMTFNDILFYNILWLRLLAGSLGNDTSPCVLSLRNRSMHNYEIQSKYCAIQRFLCNNQFYHCFSVPAIPICVVIMTSGSFRQSTLYFFLSQMFLANVFVH